MKLKIDLFMWLKSIKVNSSNQYYALFLIIVGVLFFVMNVYTPLSADDYRYAFMFGDSKRIETIYDILKSQFHHYFIMNGRLVPHLLVQFFTGITGKLYFNIANTAVFIYFLHLLVVLSGCKKNDRYKVGSIIFVLIYILYPAFGECFLWISGCVNNLWSATILLSFHYLFIKEISSKYLLPVLFLVGFICGWTHEGLVLGMMAGYMLYLLLNTSQISRTRITLLVGMSLGILFLIFSPGSINRAMGRNEVNWIIHIYNSITGLLKNGIFIVLFVVTIFSLKDVKTIRSQKVLIWMVALLISAIFVIFIAKTNYGRSYFGLSLFALIIVLNLMQNTDVYSQLKNKYVHFINICILCFSCSVLFYQKQNSQDWENVIKQINEKNEIVCTDEVKNPSVYNRFIVRYLTPETDEFYNSFMKDGNKEVERISNYYESDLVQFLPKKFLQSIKQSPMKYKGFVNDPHIPFYVKEFKGEDIEYVRLILRNVTPDDIPFYLKLISNKLQRFTTKEVKTSKFTIVTIEDERYLLISKNRVVDKRIVDVQY